MMKLDVTRPDVVHVIYSEKYGGRPVLICRQCQGVIFNHLVAQVGWQTKDNQIVDGRVYCVHTYCREAFEDKARQWQEEPGLKWFWLSAREFVWLMSDGLGLLKPKKQTSRSRHRRRK